jgi:hypothetical protein
VHDKFLPPAAAKYYFDKHLIFEISRSEISKMRCLFGYSDQKWASDSGAKWASVTDRGTLVKLNYFDVF